MNIINKIKSDYREYISARKKIKRLERMVEKQLHIKRCLTETVFEFSAIITKYQKEKLAEITKDKGK